MTGVRVDWWLRLLNRVVLAVTAVNVVSVVALRPAYVWLAVPAYVWLAAVGFALAALNVALRVRWPRGPSNGARQVGNCGPPPTLKLEFSWEADGTPGTPIRQLTDLSGNGNHLLVMRYGHEAGTTKTWLDGAPVSDQQ